MTVTTSRSKKTLHAAEQDRPDVAAARAELKAEQLSLRGKRLIFIDETSVTTKNGSPFRSRSAWRAPRRECPARPLENVDVHCGLAHQRPDCTLCHRWCDGWTHVHGLCRAGARANVGKRRRRVCG